MVAESEIPTEPPKIPVDVAWLEQKINLKCGTKGHKITDYKCSTIGEGKGFLSVVLRVDLTWDSDNPKLPGSLAIKSPTDEKIKNIEMADEIFKNGVIERLHNAEIGAYEYFNQFDPKPFPMAKYIHGRKFTSTESGLLITEFATGKSVSLNEDYNDEKIQEMVKYIARTQAYGLINGGVAENFPTVPEEFLEAGHRMALEYAGKLRESYPDRFKLTDDEIRKAVSLVEDLCKGLAEPESYLPHEPAICLGDLQPNNVMWGENQDGTLSNHVNALLDFQIVHRGFCTYDLCCVIFWGATAAQRRRMQNDLLRLYHDTLSELTGGKVFLPFAELQEQYHRCLVVFAVEYMSFVASMKEAQAMFGLTDQRIEQFVDKITSAIEEYEE